MNHRIPRRSKAAVLRLAPGPPRRQREPLDFAGRRVDPHDGVEPGVRHPRGAVGPDDHAVRRRAGAERYFGRATGRRVEPAELPRTLRGVPHRAVGRRRHVVRPRPRRHREAFDCIPGAARRSGRSGRAGGRRLPRLPATAVATAAATRRHEERPSATRHANHRRRMPATVPTVRSDYTKALRPVMARPTISVLISRVPS